MRCHVHDPSVGAVLCERDRDRFRDILLRFLGEGVFFGRVLWQVSQVDFQSDFHGSFLFGARSCAAAITSKSDILHAHVEWSDLTVTMSLPGA